MKTKLLLLNLFIAVALSGCLKDTNQPASHINDVNVSLTGTWTQDNANVSYYDATGNKVYSATNPLANLNFNGKSTLTTTYPATGDVTTDTYAIATIDTADYINITGTISHQYQIVSLQSKNLTLTETINVPDGTTLTVGNQTFNYTMVKTVNTYRKRDLPQN
ncbi:MAG TPA: hypothetical protein VK668_01160 [Mucilaginibacter sp.]|nr:hypothetical protein [Mucilaginibacter sp.]